MAVNILNNLLPAQVKSKAHKTATEVFMMYSDKELSYKVHLEPLIDDLRANGFELKEKLQNYNNHNEIGLFYPEWMLKIIKQEGEYEK